MHKSVSLVIAVMACLTLSACNRDNSLTIPSAFDEPVFPECQLADPDIELINNIGISANVKDSDASGLALSPLFAYTTLEYSVDVGYLIDSVNVFPRASIIDGDSILSLAVMVNEVDIDFGAQSQTIYLVEGQTQIRVNVIATVKKTAAFVDCELDSSDLDETIEVTHDYVITISREVLEALTYQRLSLDQLDELDLYGYSVAIYDDTLVVGVKGDDSGVPVNASGVLDITDSSTDVPLDNSIENSGAAYVYERQLDNTWSLTQFIKAPFPDEGDSFGSSVSISEDTIVVSAPKEDSASSGINSNENNDLALDSGAVYVYHREGLSWVKVAYIKPNSNLVAFDGFDNAFGDNVVAVDDQLIISASKEDSAEGEVGVGAPNSGAVYTYRRSESGEWGYASRLKSIFPRADDAFGSSLALSNNKLAVGAIGDDSAFKGILNGSSGSFSVDEADELFDLTNIDSGAVYLFSRTGNVWAISSYFKAENADDGDAFGSSVAVLDEELFVGAKFEDSAGFELDRDMDDNSLPNSGAVYRFAKGEENWSFKNYLKSTEPKLGGLFGRALALDNTLLLVGAPNEDNLATAGRGNVYLYQLLDGGGLSVTKTVGANDEVTTEFSERFGEALSISNGSAAASMSGFSRDVSGAIQADVGAVVVFD